MSTTIQPVTSDTIHVKLQFNDEYRRFFFHRSCKFAELFEKVKTILDLKEDFVVKYQDEEGEWITISTDLELETGLLLANGSLFRLQISPKSVPLQPQSTSEDCMSDEKPWKKWKGKRGGKGCKRWRNWSEDGCRRKWSEDGCRKRYRKEECQKECPKECPKEGEKETECKQECDKQECDKQECDKQECDKEEDGEWGRDWGRNHHGRRRCKKERKHWKKHFRHQDEGSSEGDVESGDSLLSLEEIKSQIEKLKLHLNALEEKKISAGQILKESKMKLREKRKNDPTDIDGMVALRASLMEKKQAFWAIFKEFKCTRRRIKKLHDLAETKN
jgi:hypothetical protein